MVHNGPHDVIVVGPWRGLVRRGRGSRKQTKPTYDKNGRPKRGRSTTNRGDRLTIGGLVISTAPGDLQAVFQSILQNATRLSDAKFAMLSLYEDYRDVELARRVG